MEAHARDSTYGTALGAIHHHNALSGHQMDLCNPTQVYYTIEAALIHTAPTIPHNTASASIADNDLVAPVICQATRFDWNKLSECIPNLDNRIIHRSKKHLFGSERIPRPPPPIPSTPIAMRTRARNGIEGTQPPDTLSI